MSDMGKPISVDKRRGFEGDGAAAPFRVLLFPQAGRALCFT